MAGAAALIVYIAIALVVARYAYGRMRAAEIESNCVEGYGMEDRLFHGFVACIVGWSWPLGAIVLAITAKPPKSPTERRAEARAREEYIRDLERELGMRKGGE